MFEMLQSLLDRVTPPAHPHVGEAYLLHQSLSAYYYLRSKCLVFSHHAQAPDLKKWWEEALKAVEDRIGQVEQLAEQRGIPTPPSVPLKEDLTDQLMALDGLAMVKGMITADAIGLQSSVHPEIALLYAQMMGNTLLFGARLTPIIEKEGWMQYPPTYETASQKQESPG